MDDKTNLQRHQWAAARRALAFWETDRIKFAFDDPSGFSKTKVNPDVFPTILDHLTNPESPLKETALIKLVESFCSSCQKTEWKRFYQPALLRKRNFDLTMGEFNLFAPEEFPRLIPFRPQSIIDQSPKELGHYYPLIEEATRGFILIWFDRVEFLNEDFTASDCEIDTFLNIAKESQFEYPMVFEAHLSDDVVLTDFFPLKDIGNWPGAMRRMAMEQLFVNYLSEDEWIILGEGLPGGADDVSWAQKEMLKMGHNPGLLFKPAERTYLEPALRVKPKIAP